jgi:hypothetical protein
VRVVRIIVGVGDVRKRSERMIGDPLCEMRSRPRLLRAFVSTNDGVRGIRLGRILLIPVEEYDEHSRH